MPAGSLGGQLQGTGSLAGQLPSGGQSVAPLSLSFKDTGTNNTPSVLILAHTTTGVPVAGFGATIEVDLTNAAGALKKSVMTDTTFWANPAAGSEETDRSINLFVGGASAAHTSFMWLASSANNPAIFLGNPASSTGIIRATSELQVLVGGSAVLRLQSAALISNVPLTVTGKVLSSNSLKQGAALTNADATVVVTNGAEFTLPINTLTAAHVLTLGVTSAATNQILRVTRLDLNAFTYTIKDDAATTLLTMAPGIKVAADFKFNGTHFVLDRWWNLN